MSSAVDAPQMKSTSLYVGDLHPLVSDALLFTKFAELGPVVNARVCRDMVSRDSLGYGYVNFRDPKDAEQALECMNYGVFFGRPFRLMWSQKDPSLRKSGKGNIFIKNLDKSITPSELYDTFEQFGKILSCKLAMDEKGVSKGFGFVHFETEEAATKAVSYVNGKEIRNRILYVGPFISRGDRKSTGGASKFNNCYVKNFGEDMDDERFRKMFEKYGEIKSACVMKSDNGLSKGFGFVCFEEPGAAEAAVKDMDGQEINGKAVYVGRAQRKAERQEELKAKHEKQRTERQSRYAPCVNLYVKNLDDSIDDEKLHETFSKYGDITSAKVMRDANGVSRSFGFVCFRSPEHAAVAVTKMNSTMLGNKPLYVAIAQRKDDRRAKLAADYQARMEQFRASMYSMHPSIPFLPTAAPATGYNTNRNFFQQRYQQTGPRWNQSMVPNAGMLPGSQPYQAAGLGAQQAANSQNLLMHYRNNAAANAGMQGRVTGGGGQGQAGAMNLAATQMANMNMYNRQGQPRPLGNAAMNTAAASGMANRVSMPAMGGQQQNVGGMMAGRGGQMPQQGGQQQAMQSRVSAPIRGGAAGGMQQAGGQATQPQQQQKDMTEVDKESQRSVLGNRLYEYVENIYPQHAAKITGMILSMDLSEVTSLFDDPKALEAGVQKAHSMLQAKMSEGGAAVDEKK